MENRQDDKVTFVVKNWKTALAYVLVAAIGALGNYFFQKLGVDKEITIKQLELIDMDKQRAADAIILADEIKKAQEASFEKATFIFDELDALLENTGAVRAIVINVHNGGREIRVGGEKKFDILYEVKAGSNIKKIKDDFVNYPLDEGNIRLIQKAIEVQNVAIHVPDVTESELLSNYETQSTLGFLGINSLTCKYIGLDRVTKQNMFFLYLNHKEANPSQGNDYIVNYTSRAGRKIREKINAY